MTKRKILLVSKVLIATFIFVSSLFSVFDTQNHQASAIDNEEPVQAIITPSQMEFISVSQNGIELEEKTWVDANDPTNTKSYYQLINDNDYVELNFRLINLEENIDYSIPSIFILGNGDDLHYSSADNGKEQTVIPYLYALTDVQDGDGEPSTCDLYSDFPIFDHMGFGSLYFRTTLGILFIDEITQGDDEIDIVDYSSTLYYDDSIETPLQFKIHAEHAKEDEEYLISDGPQGQPIYTGQEVWHYFTGAELNAGIIVDAIYGSSRMLGDGGLREQFGDEGAILRYNGGPVFDIEPVSGGVHLSDKEINLYPGETATFTITASNSFGDLIISSTDSTIASTDESALSLDNNSQTITVIANAVGTTKISVVTADDYEIHDGPVYSGQKRIITINVTEKPQSQPETTDNNQNDDTTQSSQETSSNQNNDNGDIGEQTNIEDDNPESGEGDDDDKEDSESEQAEDNETENSEPWNETENNEKPDNENDNNALITTALIIVVVITPVGIFFFIFKW